jgi:type II secretion system protein H
VRKKGFSLLELMVVLILISLSVALVTPSLSRFLRTVELKGAAKKVSAILRFCRSEAVNKGQVYQVLFDSNSREVKVQTMESTEEKEENEEEKLSPKIYILPEGVQIKGEPMTPSPYASDLPMIEFYPNGGSNGGAILLDSQDRMGYKIKVHLLTGMVEVERAKEVGR